MPETKMLMTSAEIEQVAQKLVERFRPRKIILFGSCAYGQPHEGSDLDLLVVVSNPPSFREKWQAVREFRLHSALPLQTVFMSCQEFEETKDVVGGLAYPAHHWGKVVYEANA